MSIDIKKRLYQSSIIYLVLIILLSGFFVFFYRYVNNLAIDQNIAISLQKEVDIQINKLETKYKLVTDQIQGNDTDIWAKLEKETAESDFYIMIFQKDSLVFWNNNIISGDFSGINLKKVSIVSDQTGWYLVYNKFNGNYRVLIYKRLKANFSNTHNINSRISHGLVSCKNLKFTSDKSNSDYKIINGDNEFLVGLNFAEISHLSQKAIHILFIIYIAGYILVLLFVANFYVNIIKKTNYKFIIYVSLLIDYVIIRTLEYSLDFPTILKSSVLFKQKFEILPFFNSTGDLIINAIILLTASIFFLQSDIKIIPLTRTKTKFKELIISSLIVLYNIFVLYLLNRVIEQLPYSSFYGISIDRSSVLILMALLIFISSLFIINHAFVRYILSEARQYIYLILFWNLVVILAVYLIFPLPWIVALITGVFTILFLLSYFYLSKNKRQSFYKYLILIIVYAFTTSFIVNYSRTNKKDKYQQNTLKVLSNPHDIQLEHSFRDFEAELVNDSIIHHYLSGDQINYKSSIDNYLKQNYFSDLLEKYDIQVTICKKDEMLEIKPEDIIVNCSDYFSELMSTSDNEVVETNLALISGNPESIYYIGKASVKDNDGKAVSIFIEFFFSYVPEGLGYPELLINKSVFDVDLSGYSFALYSNGQLTNKFGDFKYLTSFAAFQKSQTDELFDLNSYRHIIHKLSQDNYLIISRPKDRLSVNIVTFSVLFVIFILVLFFVVLILFGKDAMNLIRLNFQSRLQVIFLSSISLIIILLAAITLFYADANNKSRLIYQLNEKNNSVIIELQHKLSENQNFFQFDQTELEFLLKKFSMIFFTDINIYSPSGELISTSRPEIFEKGLLSDRMNPKAYEAIIYNNQLFYVLKEKMGNTAYFSSYAPVSLGGNQVAGIINLPYFAKQSELNRSYYLMIFTFIDLFVILGIVSSIIAILSSRLITRPIAVLQEKLSGIQIDKRNEIIEWKTKDEIGQLIQAYNNMIEKLEASTELLKQSERESAWREVAQQIAHEIKNPLTPMKLNIQYLEKAFYEKDPDLDNKVKNISKILINQIDTLNKVAEMFTDFAKTKSGNFEKVNLEKMISDSISLYKNHSNLKFTSDFKHGEYFTRAIEKDLTRVFNNLIKNAIHSIGEKENGEIIFKMFTKDEFHQIDIIDNGKGIADRFKANIFKPYFTTKSKGTGLGLAIVKNIMTELGGEITFESKAETGTTFTLKFPVYRT